MTISQIYGGARNIKSLVTDISYVDPNEGIRFRGFTIPELIQLLPKPAGAEMPYAGGLYYLLLVGEIPTAEQALEVEDEWHAAQRSPAVHLRYPACHAWRYPPHDHVLGGGAGHAARIALCPGSITKA